MRFRYPLKGIGISQPFTKTHKGIDFGWNNNYGGIKAPIYSVADGVVYAIEKQPHGGNVIVIKHGKLYSLYAHLSKMLVKEGQQVKCMEQIGNMGNSGKNKKTKESLPYHLHFSMYNGKYNKNYLIDPLLYLFVGENQTILPKTAKKYDLLKYGETKTCTASTLRIREKPSLTAKQVSSIKKGDKVKIYEYENGFFKVTKDSEHWASANYLK